MFALKEAYHAQLLKPGNWLPNIIAGLIVGVVALPLAMAFAIASGVKPEQGLYTAIIAAFIVGIFGGSRVQIAGPTGAFIVILAGISAQFGVAGLQIATLMAGFLLMLMGLLRLGNLIRYIEAPVIVGFTAGIGVIIFVGQWKDFFGLQLNTPLDASFVEKLHLLINALPHLNLSSTGLGVLSLLILIYAPKILPKIPSPLLAMLVATLLQNFFHFKNVSTLGSAFGGIPQNLPHFSLPFFPLQQLPSLFLPALSIALLGAIESLLSATAADRLANTQHHSNRELIGQGLANICCPLFGGFAATGAIARTATNIKHGGNAPLAAIVHSILLLLILLLLAPLANNVPLCCLSAILFVVAYSMSDLEHMSHLLKKAEWTDKLVLLTTFVLTIFTSLIIAVAVGVILYYGLKWIKKEPAKHT